MKKLFGLFLIVLVAGVGSNAQTAAVKADLNADQAWLIKHLKENGGHSDKGSDTLISEVRFTGCQLNIVTEKTGSIGGWKITTTISFDLTDIDGRDVSELPSDSRKMRIVVLRTIDGEDVVSYNTRSQHLAETSQLRSTAVITVRKKYSKEIKDKFIAVTAACQVKDRANN